MCCDIQSVVDPNKLFNGNVISIAIIAINIIII